jgi:hypothetical protein
MGKPLKHRIHDFFRGPVGYTGATGASGPKGDPGDMLSEARMDLLEQRILLVERRTAKIIKDLER